MGDYADDALDAELAGYSYDLDHPEEIEGPDDPFLRRRRGYWFGPPLRRCKYCKEFGFVWLKTPKGWRLQDPITSKVHSCLDTGGNK